MVRHAGVKRPRAHTTSTLLQSYLSHLGDAQEAVVLGQQGQVAQTHAGPDTLVDGAVAEVHLGGVEAQVGGRDHSVHREGYGLRLVGEARRGRRRRRFPNKRSTKMIHMHFLSSCIYYIDAVFIVPYGKLIFTACT